jgi:CHAT domain-containing protein/Tfp pilus assembly protein PilF
MRKILVIIFLILCSSISWVSVDAQPDQIIEETKALSQRLYQLEKESRYEEAIPYARRLLEIVEKELPKDDHFIDLVLNGLANLYQVTGRYSEAAPLCRKSLEIREKLLGKDHLDVAQSLQNLAMIYGVTGRYAEAEPLYKRSLEIREKVLGKEHLDVAWSLNNLGALYYDTARYAKAEPLHKRALEIREKLLGKEHLDVALSLNNLAMIYGVTGRYAEAEPLYKRSLEIREKVLGKEHLDVAWSLNNLGFLYQATNRYTEAEPLYKRSLEIRERVLGKDHPDVVASLNNLASIYKNTGRYAEAEVLLKRSLEINEKVLGKDHPEVAGGLNDLALIYQDTDRYAEAERLHKRSLEIREKVLGNDHPDVAASLNNLALIYGVTGRYAEAESLYKRSLEIRERVLGKDHLDVAQSFSNLAWICAKRGRFEEAESLLTRSLVIREKELGKDHPFVAGSLNELGVIYWKTGRYSEAELILKRAIGIMESKLGKEHLDPIILINMAAVYANIENHLESHQMLIRGIKTEEIQRENTFLVLSERQKLNYMEQRKWLIHGLVSHTLGHMQDDDHAIRETFDTWLNWKGSVMEAQGRYIEALTYSDNPEIRKKFDELNNTRREIAKLQLSNPEKMSTEDYRKRLEELEGKKESLEAELGRLSKDFAFEKMAGRAETKSISEILIQKGKDSVYIDFAQINPFDLKEKKFDNPRYFIFVLMPGKEPMVKLLDLSDAGKLDGHIRAYLEEMKRAKEYGELPKERILKAEANAIYEMLIKPIEAYIKGKKHLYISPDGNLNLIPFEVLMTPDGKYLMEEYNITYIAAGRDIMRFMDETVAEGGPLIMADPDYDMGLTEKTEVAKSLGIIETRGPAPLSKDAKDLRFKRLPDTKKEANAIEKTLKESYKIDVRNYQDKRALEEVLLTVKEPKILHLATHGYFLKDEEVKHHQTLGFLLLDREVIADLAMENLMLRSGIVLAGVNASLKEGRDDGVVSAEKILGLKLKGTDLVVLSACETGTGDVKSGEGVFGLKRSFILSGAKTVVMSLWSIPSKETTELMTDFYTLMAQGKSKSEALREARLNLMKKKPNPFYWGAFIMVGNPN